MCVVDQSVSLARKIQIRRRESVQERGLPRCNLWWSIEKKSLYEIPIQDSFLHLHQEKSHTGEDENFKLSVTRFYGKDKLSCEIAEAVVLRSRTGDVCNLKSEWSTIALVQVTGQVQRGLWLAGGHSYFSFICSFLVSFPLSWYIPCPPVIKVVYLWIRMALKHVE